MFSGFSPWMLCLICLICFGILLWGGHILVKGAQALCFHWKVSPLTMGLVVVAFGTSLPEIFTAIYGSIAHKPDLILGNIFGGGIINLCLGMGIPALINPIKVHEQFVRRDMPYLVGAILLFFVFAYDGTVGLVGGILCLLAAVGFFWRLKYSPSVDLSIDAKHDAKIQGHPVWAASLVILGLVLLWIGAEGVVDSAVEIAKLLDVEDRVIGFVLLGAGTALPEIVTAGIASCRKQYGLCVGNIIGCGLVNLLVAGGGAAVISPLHVSRHYRFYEMPLYLLVVLIFWRMLCTGRVISRFEGGLLVVIYLACLAVIVH